MSDNLIELPKLVEEKIISYRKYYILEHISPHYSEQEVLFSAIYDEKHVHKMVNYVTTIFQKAFEENRISSITIKYLDYGDQYNGYYDIENSNEYYDTYKIEETEIMRLLTYFFGNLRIQGHKDMYCDGSLVKKLLGLDYIIREIDMNNNPIDISQSDEQLENVKKWKERLEKMKKEKLEKMKMLESEESS